MQITLDNQDVNTILAALRFYQEHDQGEPANRSDAIHDIATNGDRDISLDNAGIDELCERINTAPQPNLFTVKDASGIDETGFDVINDQTYINLPTLELADAVCVFVNEAVTLQPDTQPGTPCDACGGTGFHRNIPADPADFPPDTLPAGWLLIERCDACEKFPDDETAAASLYAEYRTILNNQSGHSTIANPATRREAPTLPADMRELQADLEKLGVCLSDEQIRRLANHQYMVVRGDLAVAKAKGKS